MIDKFLELLKNLLWAWNFVVVFCESLQSFQFLVKLQPSASASWLQLWDQDYEGRGNLLQC